MIAIERYKMRLLSTGVTSDRDGVRAGFWGGTLTFACFTPVESNQHLREVLECWLDAEPRGHAIIDDSGLVRELSGVEIVFSGKAFDEAWLDAGNEQMQALVTVRYRTERRPLTQAVRERV